MGGKRPDQHNIDPRHDMSQDNKSSDNDRHTHAEDKLHLVESREDSREEGGSRHIPSSGVNPALQELRDFKARNANEEE